VEKQLSGFEIRTKQNTKRLAFWSITWTVTMALAVFGPKFIWDGNPLLTMTSILVNVIFGAGMILSNIRYIKGLDEMQQKIHLEAMGVALGVGVVGGLSYSIFDITNLIAGNAEISHVVILMSLTYLGTLIYGQVRYR
jgi:hypothetical protein